MISAVLAALAILALTSRGGPDRLAGLHPEPDLPASVGLPPGLTRTSCCLVALALWWLVQGVAGGVLALVFLAFGPQALARLDAEQDQDALVARDLPLALDLLAACLTGGASTVDAARAVSAAVPGPCGDRFAAVAARLAVGSEPAQAWRCLGNDRGPAGAAARAMSRAAVGGAPVAAAVQRVAEAARLESGARAERAARRAGVLAVGPLGLCFLPAFLLLGVVPAVLGLAAPLLASL